MTDNTENPGGDRATSAERGADTGDCLHALHSRRHLLERLAIGGAVGVAGCGQDGQRRRTPTDGSNQEPTTPQSTANGPTVRGQTFRAPIGDDPSKTTFLARHAMRPASLFGWDNASVQLQRVLLETGLWTNATWPGGDARVYYAWLDEPMEISPTEVHISIRDDAKWSDGHQITGRDIATIPLQYTIRQFRPPYYADDDGTPENIYHAIDDFDITDQSVTYRSAAGHFDAFWDLTFKKRLGTAFGPHLIPTHVEPYSSYADAVIETTRQAQAGEINPWNRGSGDPHKQALVNEQFNHMEYAEKFSNPKHVLATGVWDLVGLRGSEAFVFSKNPHHRHADEVNFETFELEYTPTDGGASRMHAALKSDRFDYATGVTPDAVAKSFPNHLTQLLVPAGLYSGNELALNFDHPGMGNRSVRAALMYALDHTAIANNIHRTAAVPVTTPGGDCWDATEWASQDWIDESLISYDTDRARAATLMREAGFTKSNGNWVGPDGERFTLTIPTTGTTPRWEPTVRSQLREFGIHTSLTSLGQNTFRNRVEQGEFPAWPSQLTSATNTAPSTLFIWLLATRNRYTYDIFPDEQFQTGAFSDSGVPIPLTEDRWRVFTVQAPPIGHPDRPLQTYRPGALSLSTYTNPPLEEFRHRVKTGMWLANWFLPTIPITKTLEQHFIDDSHWLWPTDTASWKHFTDGDPRRPAGIFASGGVRANPDNPNDDVPTG